ncbi:hypothetical protein DUT91_23725 [Phyllobacterium salinisoli]|uniref:Uncharacterized protein n=1 Tax=Phyllobacterium salinisoli TaxID=1899321 RepID=A0A368JWF8_9HYPH|nr:hypothetical protein [Phyllobacterium salinisoli]RCS21487.1 hypothetical protein DUT91_23725 [Phyllobacterium salinisoli]
MREPINDLSPAARELVGRIEKAPAHEVSALVRNGDHEQTFGELRGFIASVRERFGVPGSLELDRDRLAQAIPNATPERVRAFSSGFSRAEFIASRVVTVQQANTLQMTQDNQHSQSKGRSFEF